MCIKKGTFLRTKCSGMKSRLARSARSCIMWELGVPKCKQALYILQILSHDTYQGETNFLFPFDGTVFFLFLFLYFRIFSSGTRVREQRKKLHRKFFSTRRE